MINLNNIKTTREHFNKTIDELLITNSVNYTKEENLIFDSGVETIFFDSKEELENEKIDLEEYIMRKGYTSIDLLETINERIVVILN